MPLLDGTYGGIRLWGSTKNRTKKTGMNEFSGSEPWHNFVVAPLTNEKTSRRLNGSYIAEKGRGPEISKVTVNNV